MATRKPKGSTSTALVKWDEKLAARANMAQKAEESVATGNMVSLQGGVISIGGNAVPGNKLNCIIVDSILENHLYEDDFDPSNPASPICYAYGRIEKEMKPFEGCQSPQSEACRGCPMNEWESAAKGKGKACKNVRRLALIPEDALESAEAISDAQVAYLRVPVTSVKNWAGYVNKLAASNLPTLAFVTEISVTPDPKSQFKVNFNAVNKIEDGEAIGALLTKADEVEKSITFPYADTFQNEEAPRGKAKSAAKKAPAKRPPIKQAAPAKQPPIKQAAAAPGRRKF